MERFKKKRLLVVTAFKIGFLLLYLLHPFMSNRVRRRRAPVVMLSSSDAVAPRFPNKIRYNRVLPTGLGDRFSCYLCAAAYARALNATCYAYWHNEPHNHERQYDIEEILRVMTLPSNLIMYTSVEQFLSETDNVSDIQWDGGVLPATNAFDGLYTTALQTFRYDPALVNQESFVRAYQEAASEWDVHVSQFTIPSTLRYVVLHMRGSDKGWGGLYKPTLSAEGSATWVENDGNVNHYSSFYCTFEAVDTFHRENPTLPIFLISEDHSAKRRIMADFGHVLSSIPYPVFSDDPAKTKLYNELMDMELMMHAAGIIQHSPRSWSAFSSNIAAAKSIPLLNTWKHPDKLFNEPGYRQAGAIPREILICEDQETNVRAFSDKVRAL